MSVTKTKPVDGGLSSWRPAAGSSVAPFEQLRLLIADLIGRGVLPVGSKLPTVRALASSSGLAVNTVARAFRELESAGVVHTLGRGGTVVAASGDAIREQVAQAAAEFAAVVHGLGLPEADALAIAGAALRR
ncbi:GntR family transcriptional regulator [Arthrobacter russicus]|uniref:DNA-binding transcriptional regulator YhcF (GntR family) n=1 Tax=Arthrobacter russicus TaxID=172040 RepID=A0ABU1JGK5_9MICC|nr:GntR family transcriptional regulator [Arthrobacter russicus]MBQ1442590.1 GntR family transcriptional regulator [Renibacterium sp.]MDR6271274.1 DNA-binding transcriptional regulator YhcF (GntR family) [Arthrobacter russicus]